MLEKNFEKSVYCKTGFFRGLLFFALFVFLLFADFNFRGKKGYMKRLQAVTQWYTVKKDIILSKKI